MKPTTPASSHTRQRKRLTVIQNEYLALYFNGSTGRLVMIKNKEIQLTEPLAQGFSTYDSYFDGAYSFLAQSQVPVTVNPDGLVDLKIIKGNVVEEVHQTFSDDVSQVVRLYRGDKFAEFQWIVGPVNNSDGNGKNVISRFSSQLDSGRLFYTDSNGRETMERRRKLREGTLGRELVSSNYYPVTTRIYIQDIRRNLQLTVIPDRAQGGSSLSSGDLELMVHRRTSLDDGYGLNEPLYEVSRNGEGVIYTGKHYVCLDTIERSAELVRRLAIQKHLEPSVMFTPVEPGMKLDLAMTLRLVETRNSSGHNSLYDNSNSVFLNPDFNFTFQSFLFRSLPDNIHLMTLDYMSGINDCQVLMRLEHVYEVDEHPILSDSVIFSFREMFITYEITEVTETSLGVYMKQNFDKKFAWENFERKNQQFMGFKSLDQIKVLLRPMEIKTFILKLVPRDWTRDWTSVRESTVVPR
ncbi:Lysosomal alpha-mannosidase [Bulinus truncatus]|nr:Lysosomal alpha-mannosidase [Bulinus truncatus]